MQERGLDMHVPCTGLVRARQLMMLAAGLGELGLAGLVRLWAKERCWAGSKGNGPKLGLALGLGPIKNNKHMIK